MRLITFGLLTAAGSLVWNSALILAGYLLGEQWDRVQGSVDIVQKIVLAAVGVWLIVFVARRTRTRSS
jgi:membrane protein DedA with SNARE-associated domain